MTEKRFAALVVEDSEDEAELMMRELRRGGFDLSYERVATAEGMRAALERDDWYIIICDHVMPGFNALRALEILRQSGRDIPFVVVSGRIGEEFAVEIMRAGAQDFVMKDRISRLVPVVERELAEAEGRRRRRAAEQALRESEARISQTYATLHDALESSPSALALYDAEDRLMVWNSKFAELPGSTKSPPHQGTTCEALMRQYADSGKIDFRGRTKEQWLADRMRSHRQHGAPFEIFMQDGRVFQVSEQPTAAGGIASSYADVTLLIEREELLRQAQKMEAVGQLTGGVAHDFNNLLAIIMGNLEMLQEDMGEDAPSFRKIERSLQASGRAATLIQRLLSFSRRQALKPEVLNPGDLVAGMNDMLRRTLSVVIQIEIGLAPDLWYSEVDPAQLESALLNLAINARDAMPDGGVLTIETCNVHLGPDDHINHSEVLAGDYVLLSVSDTGSGMSPAVIERAFDPFYTTKEVGKGSGLGLSMVYGFVKQSGGHVTIDSEVGKGTRVSLYLPRTAERRDERPPSPAVAGAAVGRGETVLVVEDDPDVRDLAVDMLHELGYRVIEAANGPAALDLLDSSPDVDMVLSDLILPGGMKGNELVEEVNRRRPAVKVLLMSGYSDSAAVRHGRFDNGIHLLAKPFRLTELASRVRQVLDSPAP